MALFLRGALLALALLPASALAQQLLGLKPGASRGEVDAVLQERFPAESVLQRRADAAAHH